MSRVKNKYESEKIIEERIKNRDICDEMSESYLEYSISVILDRAIPQLRDGLKPVQRRILYTMKNMDTFKKSARVVGEVMGHYHPKGDSSIYGAIVRMAQNFRMYVPFITPQGNFGSLDASDSPSAMRYSECHIDPVSKDIFFTNNLLGMEYKDNYDSSELEPVCLTPMFPAILVNGTIGIAVGIATYIPTHNPIEVIKTYEAFIQGKLNNNNIRKYLKGPDPVIPCNVIDVNGGIDRAYRTGSGKYHCMSHYHVEDDTRGKKKLVFTSVLPSRSKDVDILNLVTKCRDQRNPLSQMIADIRDESSKEGIRVVVTIKKDITVEAAIEALIAARFCYDSFSISMRVIYRGRPMKLGIMDMMSHFHRMNSETTVVHLTALKENKKKQLN